MCTGLLKRYCLETLHNLKVQSLTYSTCSVSGSDYNLITPTRRLKLFTAGQDPCVNDVKDLQLSDILYVRKVMIFVLTN